jgi:hypothetical protein
MLMADRCTWNDVLPDTVQIGTGEPMSMHSWMRKSMVPFKECALSLHSLSERGF